MNDYCRGKRTELLTCSTKNGTLIKKTSTKGLSPAPPRKGTHVLDDEPEKEPPRKCHSEHRDSRFFYGNFTYPTGFIIQIICLIKGRKNTFTYKNFSIAETLLCLQTISFTAKNYLYQLPGSLFRFCYSSCCLFIEK